MEDYVTHSISGAQNKKDMLARTGSLTLMYCWWRCKNGAAGLENTLDSSLSGYTNTLECTYTGP